MCTMEKGPQLTSFPFSIEKDTHMFWNAEVSTTCLTPFPNRSKFRSQFLSPPVQIQQIQYRVNNWLDDDHSKCTVA